jgi:RNA polymerase sigma factor (TIGR02999 family)
MDSPTDGTSKPISEILSRAAQDERVAARELLPLVYDQLRAIALRRLEGEAQGHTLQATALVHEAYLRLVGKEDPGWEGRGHFYVAAAEAMRRILIDHARTRGRDKRGGGAQRLPIDVLELASSENPAEILAVDEAICRLGVQDDRLAKLARLRLYAGLSHAEVAATLDRSERSVRRDWALARAWLARELDQGDESK